MSHEEQIAELKSVIKNLESINERLVTIITRAQPDKFPGAFICGMSSIDENDGLPFTIEVCPTMGAAGAAMYKKITNYSEPEY